MRSVSRIATPPKTMYQRSGCIFIYLRDTTGDIPYPLSLNEISTLTALIQGKKVSVVIAKERLATVAIFY
jgi:hypothetical protein